MCTKNTFTGKTSSTCVKRTLAVSVDLWSAGLKLEVCLRHVYGPGKLVSLRLVVDLVQGDLHVLTPAGERNNATSNMCDGPRVRPTQSPYL